LPLTAFMPASGAAGAEESPQNVDLAMVPTMRNDQAGV
jgi:hypothetical protein